MPYGCSWERITLYAIATLRDEPSEHQLMYDAARLKPFAEGSRNTVRVRAYGCSAEWSATTSAWGNYDREIFLDQNNKKSNRHWRQGRKKQGNTKP